jgi:hypothetical protein
MGEWYDHADNYDEDYDGLERWEGRLREVIPG